MTTCFKTSLKLVLGSVCRGREGAFSAEAYYQASMMEDPWKQLRQRQLQQQPPAGGASAGAGVGAGGGVESRLDGDGAADRPWH